MPSHGSHRLSSRASRKTSALSSRMSRNKLNIRTQQKSAGTATEPQSAAGAETAGPTARQSATGVPLETGVACPKARMAGRSITELESDHRTWQQRGGYSGYCIPESRYSGHFSSGHAFVIYSQPYIGVGGLPRFQYGGYWLKA
jgi:hypothetical protein